MLAKSFSLTLVLIIITTVFFDILSTNKTVADLSPSYNNVVNGPVYDIAVNPHGELLVAGDFSEKSIYCINGEGHENRGFGDSLADGFNKPVHSIKSLKSGEILAGGKFTTYNDSLTGHMVKLDPKGALDVEFAKNMGTGFDDSVHTLIVDEFERIYVGGEFRSYNGQEANYLVRLNKNGSLDKAFDVDGPVYDLSWLTQGRHIVISGEFSKVGPFEYKNLIVANLEEL